jgi:hypothetical protein
MECELHVDEPAGEVPEFSARCDHGGQRRPVESLHHDAVATVEHHRVEHPRNGQREFAELPEDRRLVGRDAVELWAIELDDGLTVEREHVRHAPFPDQHGIARQLRGDRGEHRFATGADPVADIEALGEAEVFQAPNPDLERITFHSDLRRQLAGDDARVRRDQPQVRLGPGGAAVHPAEALA